MNINLSFTATWTAIFLTIASNSLHATAVDVSTPSFGVPPNITTSSNKPMVMLAASKDHTLFGPIYTDFEALEDDGVLNTDFTPTFKYYGYFDSTKCYSYSGTDERFNPAAIATIVPTTVGTATKSRYTCPSTQSYWSGNFLNWASMGRLDVVRKMLYGGKRSTDTSSLTVLERMSLSYDAHSFTKFYKGTDVRDYTPFTTTSLTKTIGPNANVYAGLTVCNTGDADSPSNKPIMRLAKGNYRLWGTVEHRVCRFKDEPIDNDSKFTSKLARYYKDSDKGGGGVFHETALPLRATDGATYGSTIGPELTMRVKVCDSSLLGEERCQAFPPDSTTNYKPYGLLQEFGYSATASAARAEFGVITGSYDNNTTAGGLRKNMGDFAAEINSTTGVFCHATSSGCSATLASPDGRTTGNGAIKAFDSIVLYGRTSLSYGGSSIDTLPAWGNPIGEMVVQALQYYAYNGTTPTPTNPSTTTKDTASGLSTIVWSDPLSNSDATRKSRYGNSICRPLYVLALSSSAQSYDGDSADTPFDTLPNRNLGGDIASSYSLNQFTNKVGDADGITNTVRSVGTVSSATSLLDLSCSGKTVTNLSGVRGVCPDAPAMQGSYKVAGAALYANTNKIRTVASPPTDLKYVQDALKVKTLTASLNGGSARIEILIPGSNPKKYVYLTPESVWSGNIGAPLTFASISSSATHGAFIVTWNDALLGGDYDMDLTGFLRYDLIANASSPTGWDIQVTTDVPANCSGASGTHGFSIIGVTLTPGGTSGNGRYLTHQHFSRGTISALVGKEGYLCGDTNYRNATSANNTTNYIFNSTANVDGACYVNPLPVQTGSAGYCNVQDTDFPIKIRFNMVGAGDAVLKDPLWYAAKYGSFTSSTKKSDSTYNDIYLPTNTSDWDKVKSDGTPGADGVPDGYYLARRPDLLEQQLRKALDDLAKNSNSAPAVSSSQLITDGFKYVAKFDSTTIEGNIEAYRVDSLGYFLNDYSWRAGHLLRTRTSGANGDNGDSRAIITNNGNASSTAASSTGGFKFRWSALPPDYVTAMTSASTNKLNSTNAQLTLNYLRGDQSKEAISTGLRVRNDNILGPVVNATPWIQDRPVANYFGSQFEGYADFVEAQKNRSKVLWVGANDGMMHAFNPNTGSEVFAYVPGSIANRLAEIPMQRGRIGRTRVDGANFTLDPNETMPDGVVWPYVDGNPFTSDIQVTNGNSLVWKTYLFSALGRGGKGIFALDVTNTDNLSTAEFSGNPNSIFKWQFTSDDDADLGYIISDISTSSYSGQAGPIVKLNNGKFAVIVGNGVKSTAGKSVLYILYTDGPNPVNGSWSGRFKKIIADSGSGNGLSTPTWVDLDNNGTADYVYAGDLKGNLWKFNLSSDIESDWDVAYKVSSTNVPIFTATDGTTRLPITTAPEIAYPPFDGLIVNFATGNSFEAGNFPNTAATQKVFGIWDRPAFSLSIASGGRALPNSNMSTMVARTYSRQTSGNVIVTGSPVTVDWTTKDGWYFDLPGSSEMVLSDPDLRAGVLTFTTVRPNTDTESCSSTPNVSLYAIDPISGKPERNIQGITTISTVSYLNAGTSALDQKVRVVNDRTKRPFTKECRKGDPGCTCTTTNNVETCEKTSPQCKPGQSALRVVGQGTDATLCYSPNGRVQWREIPGLRTDQ